MKLSSPRVFGLAAALLLGTSSIALATPSGTPVTNTIDLSYETGGVTITEDDAATVTFVVDTGVDLVVEGQDAGNAITVTQGQNPAVLTFRVENLSNDTFGFDIDVASSGTLGLVYDPEADDADPVGKYSVYYGTSATYNAGTATLYNANGTINVMDRDEGEEFYVYIVANVPSDAVDGQADTFDVTATALNESTNTVVTESGTGDPSTVDVVFADPGADGEETDTETATVSAPDLTATKTQTLISENLDGTFNCASGTADPAAEAHVPGACVEYTITIANGSDGDVATNLQVSDTLPSDVTYVTHDAGTFDTVTLSGSTLTGTEASLAAGASVTFTVRATINE